MFFSMFNYYKKRIKKITLKQSEAKDIVKKIGTISPLRYLSLREENKKAVL